MNIEQLTNEELVKTFIEVTAEQNEEALSCLPPIYFNELNGQKVSGFAVAEPFTHTAEGFPIFSCYAELFGIFYTFHAVLKKTGGKPIGFNYNNEEFSYDNSAFTNFKPRTRFE